MRILQIAALLALAACSSPPAQGSSPAAAAPEASQPKHPVSGLQIIPLTVTQDGKAHRFKVEVASSPEEQARGLMFRREMAPDEGMLFPRTPPDLASFWMKNTVIPLDIVFIGSDRRIINIEANAEPYSLEPRRSAGLTAAVLELNGGRAAELGIEPGARVDW